MTNRLITLLSAIVLTASAANAQTSLAEIIDNPLKAGGVYYPYPVTESLGTPAPEGFKPFYVSHYGRHGSRYLISDNDYVRVLQVLQRADSAGVLTPLGREVLERTAVAAEEGRGRGGELTPLGRRQHKGIARRMYQAYPEVFAGDPEITAASTTVMRCAHSMFAFIEGLKELDSTLDIARESSRRHMYFLNYHSKESGPYAGEQGEWFGKYNDFRSRMTHPERLIATLMTDTSFDHNFDAADLMWGLYWIAVDLPNMESPVSLIEIFTPEELYQLWQVVNFNFYACCSSYPDAKGLHVDNAKNLLQNVIDSADRYIAEGRNGATLRFGHDGNVIPFTALLQFPGCVVSEPVPDNLSAVWTDFKITPMASNVQIVFYRNDSGEVIAKFLHNEREVPIGLPSDIYPFYRWSELRTWLQHLIDTPSRDLAPEPRS